MPSLWTRSYFVSTAGNVSSETMSVLKPFNGMSKPRKRGIRFMQLSETIKLYSTKEQETLIQAIMLEYISTVNSLVSDATRGTNINKYTSRNVEANLPSALKNQCIRDAKSIVKKHYKTCHKTVLKNRNLAKKGSTLKITAPSLPILKKPCCYKEPKPCKERFYFKNYSA